MTIEINTVEGPWTRKIFKLKDGEKRQGRDRSHWHRWISTAHGDRGERYLIPENWNDAQYETIPSPSLSASRAKSGLPPRGNASSP